MSYCGTCSRPLGFAGQHECRLPGDPEGTCRHPLHGRAIGVCPACREPLNQFPPGFVPAKVYMDGPEFLAWLRAAWDAAYRAGAWMQEPCFPEPDATTFEEWVRERLGTDSVRAETPESPNP